MEPTHDQQVCLSHWHRFGGAGFVRKVGPPRRSWTRGWIITDEGICAPIGDVPTVFKTKKEAVAFADNLMLIRSKQWRGLDPYATAPEEKKPIPRVIQCWYCRNEQHERCSLPETCACYRCYPNQKKEG